MARPIKFDFPVRGLDRFWAHRKTPIQSTPDCLNCRGFGQEGGRLRGGQRPGMRNWHPGTGALGNAVGTDAFSGTGLNDITAAGTYTGSGITTFQVEIDLAAATDKFKWTRNGGVSWTSGVAMTGAAQTLALGVTVTFAATTGHTLADKWEFTAKGSPIRLLSSVTTTKTADSYTGTDEDDFNREDSKETDVDIGDGWYSPFWQLYDDKDKLRAWETSLEIKNHRVENPNGNPAHALRTTFGQPEVSDGTAYVVRFDIGVKGGDEDYLHAFLQLNDLDPNLGNEGIDVRFALRKTSNLWFVRGEVKARYGVDASDITDFGGYTNSNVIARGAWARWTVYRVGDTTTHGGVTYMCIGIHFSHKDYPPPRSRYWVTPAVPILSSSTTTVSLSMLANTLTISLTVDGVTGIIFGPTDLTVSPALQGRTVGIALEKKNTLWIDNWQVSGLLLQGTPTTRKTILVAGTNAKIEYESTPGTMTVVTGDAAIIASQYPVMAAELDSKLYIADYAEPRKTLAAAAGTIGGVGHDELTATAGGLDWTALGINKDTDVVVLTGDTPAAANPVSGNYKITTVAAGKLTLSSSTVRDGTCAVRVVKAPLVYDPAANTVAIWTATSGYGNVPTGCQLICRYRGSLVMARNDEDLANWYMCRMKDPLDWDYGETDYQAAAYYVGGDVGKPGDSITALIPWKDDYLILGCANSIWLMRGHPKDGGALDAISYEAGVLSGTAWAAGPTGAVYWLGPGGFYGMQSVRGDINPKNLSQDSVPRDLVDINPENYLVVLSYDTERYGVWVTVTSKASGASRSWFWDERLNAFWPDRYPASKDPTVAYNYVADSAARSNLLMGCRDGRLRVFDDAAKDDEGVAIDSYVVYPPQALDNGADTEGTLTELRADLSENTDRVDYQLRPGKTFEAAVTASPGHSGSWNGGGMRPALHYRVRGKALCLRLSNLNVGQGWETEGIVGTVIDGGKARY